MGLLGMRKLCHKLKSSYQAKKSKYRSSLPSKLDKSIADETDEEEEDNVVENEREEESPDERKAIVPKTRGDISHAKGVINTGSNFQMRDYNDYSKKSPFLSINNTGTLVLTNEASQTGIADIIIKRSSGQGQQLTRVSLQSDEEAAGTWTRGSNNSQSPSTDHLTLLPSPSNPLLDLITRFLRPEENHEENGAAPEVLLAILGIILAWCQGLGLANIAICLAPRILEIPRPIFGLSVNKIVICDILGHEHNLQVPASWFDFKLALRERAFNQPGFEKILRDQFDITYRDSANQIRRIGPNNWRKELVPNKRFTLSAIILGLEMSFQKCARCESRLNYVENYSTCPKCHLSCFQMGDQGRIPNLNELIKVRKCAAKQLQQDHLAVPGSISYLENPYGLKFEMAMSRRRLKARHSQITGTLKSSPIADGKTSTSSRMARMTINEEENEEEQEVQDNDLNKAYSDGGSEQRETKHWEVNEYSHDKELRRLEQKELSYYKNITSASNFDVLYQAAKSGHLDSVRSILEIYEENGLKPDDIWGEWGTPLVAAIMSRSFDITKALLDIGSDPIKPAGLLGCPLHAAALRADQEIFELVLLYAERSWQALLHTEGEYQEALDISLFRSAQFNHKMLIQPLLQAGANPFKQPGGISQSALRIATVGEGRDYSVFEDYLHIAADFMLLHEEEVKWMKYAFLHPNHELHEMIEDSSLRPTCANIQIGDTALAERTINQRLNNQPLFRRNRISDSTKIDAGMAQITPTTSLLPTMRRSGSGIQFEITTC
ncbi:unnamed protein product [Clonostachys byssicola]|uniref:Uncharacterized protein n=1 Tax=Clonostachys byssicola TaxID=160290 RepID=A0A9N9YA62_9HYPO|nr:unnamed protein product [Clonostachys byssicola]